MGGEKLGLRLEGGYSLMFDIHVLCKLRLPRARVGSMADVCIDNGRCQVFIQLLVLKERDIVLCKFVGLYRLSIFLLCGGRHTIITETRVIVAVASSRT